MTTQIARHWRLKAQRYRLVGNVCPDCARTIFPPRKVCPHCAEKAEKPFHFSGYEDTPVLATLLIRQGNEVFRREIHQSEESFGLKSRSASVGKDKLNAQSAAKNRYRCPK